MVNGPFGGPPAGTYTITYTKATFQTQTQAGVGVLPEAANSPDTVELRHGSDLGANQLIDFSAHGYRHSYNTVHYSPDREPVLRPPRPGPMAGPGSRA